MAVITVGVVACYLLLCLLVTAFKVGVFYYNSRRHFPASAPSPAALAGLVLSESAFMALLFFVRLLWLGRGRINPRPGAEGRSPVVLVHGYLMHGSSMWFIARRLRRAGHSPAYCVTLSRLLVSIEELAETLAADLRRILEQHPGQRIVIVAHSMGGLAARVALRDGELAARVRRLITLGTPHYGTALARFGPGRNARQMEPGSSFLGRLVQEPSPVAVTCFRSRRDNVVFPPSTQELAGADVVDVGYVGHMRFLLSGRVGRLLEGVVAGAPSD